MLVVLLYMEIQNHQFQALWSSLLPFCWLAINTVMIVTPFPPWHPFTMHLMYCPFYRNRCCYNPSIERHVVITIIRGVVITIGRNVTKKTCFFLPCLLLPFVIATYMLTIGHTTLLGKVIKTNVMWPFCIECHIDI